MLKMLKIRASGICLILFLILLSGCAMHKALSKWHGDSPVITDGSDSEWQGEPQYYDKSKRVTVRVMNDMDAIYLCFSTGSEKLKQTIMMSGLTVWLDPKGGKDKVLGICVPSGRRPGGRPPMSDFSNREKKPPEHMGEGRMPPVETPVELEITYPDTTGSITMTTGEARKSGIEIGAGQPDGGRIVYEFKIRFNADESLLSLKPGMFLGIGVETGEMKMLMDMDMPDRGYDMGMPVSITPAMDMGPPQGGGMGGGMRGGPGGGPPPSEKLGESFNVWIKVQLADILF